jgi:hypothetical protein
VNPLDRVFPLEGVPCRLVLDEDVREADIAACRVTVERADNGERARVDAAEVMFPPVPGGNMTDPERPYSLRLVLEEMLALGFTDEWIAVISNAIRRHRLLETVIGEGD